MSGIAAISKARTSIKSAKAAPTSRVPSSLKPIVGFMFFFHIGLALLKDVTDVAFAAIMAAGLGLTSMTLGLGAIIGLPLFAIGLAGKILVTLCVLIALVFFLYFNSVPSMSLIYLVLGSLLDAAPLIDFLPVTTMAFVGTIMKENMARGGGGMLRLAVAAATPGGIIKKMIMK